MRTASTQVRLQSLPYLKIRNAFVRIHQQSRGTDEQPTGAVPALRSLLINEGRLKRPQKMRTLQIVIAMRLQSHHMSAVEVIDGH